MVDDVTKKSATTDSAATQQAKSNSAAGSLTGKDQQVSKDQFLQLLVTQLKNQDPLDPMKNEDFAVNLAQFSQLEQLVSINDKVGASSSGQSASLASYLGHEVTLSSKSLHVEAGDGGLLKVKLPENAESLEVELVGSDGTAKQVVRFENVPKGSQTLEMKGLTVDNGDYTYKVKATSGAGSAVAELEGRAAGVVTGFVPGDQPKLIVGGKEIEPSEIAEVGLPAAT